LLPYCKNTEYIEDINNHINILKNDEEMYHLFITDIRKYGLYFEFPLFVSIDLSKLNSEIEREYGFKPETKVTFKRDFIEYAINELEIKDFALPDTDVEIEAFCSFIYYMKLYKIADDLMRVRDTGPINAITKINVKNEQIALGSKCGYMELFCLISHGNENIIHELRNAKSDNIPEKQKSMTDCTFSRIFFDLLGGGYCS
jgi:hypothetical protein